MASSLSIAGFPHSGGRFDQIRGGSRRQDLIKSPEDANKRVMHWILLTIIGVTLIFVSYRLPNVALGTLIALLLAGVIAYFATEDVSDTRSSVETTVITLSNLNLEPSYADSYQLTGRIENQDPSSMLSSARVTITLQDCLKKPEDNQDHCTIISEQNEGLHLMVPPAQASDFSISFFPGELHLQGELRWKVTLIEVKSD